jgi:hypothetical protein
VHGRREKQSFFFLEILEFIGREKKKKEEKKRRKIH